jgi:hypothetical protein
VGFFYLLGVKDMSQCCATEQRVSQVSDELSELHRRIAFLKDAVDGLKHMLADALVPNNDPAPPIVPSGVNALQEVRSNIGADIARKQVMVSDIIETVQDIANRLSV